MGFDLDGTLNRISEFADYSMWKEGTPGLVFGVTSTEKTLFLSAKGVSDVMSRRQMPVDALFQIGSVSKSFTCMALLQLAEEGVLDIHAPVLKYLPWFSVKSKHSEITLHHLMTHTAGIVQGSDATPQGWTEVWDLREMEATFEPGTHFHYSNSGYKALGLVLETVTGRTSEKIIRQGILERAGMRSAAPIITNSIRGRLAVAHEPLHDDRPFKRGSELYPATWFEGDTADGSICASVEDMMAYVRILLNKGEGPWGPVVTARSFDLMTTPYIQPGDALHHGEYGYGLNIEKVDGHTYIGHQGGMVGYYTSMLIDMDSGLGIIVMVNGPGEPEVVARFGMKTLRAASSGTALPEVPSKEDVYKVQDTSDYVGKFSGPDGILEVVSREGELHVVTDGNESPIERKERDSFIVYGPGFDLFLLEFERRNGVVERVHHGSRSYAREGSLNADRLKPETPSARYEGHYRSHNPWMSNFRIVSRPEGLTLILPEGESQPLTQIGKDEFRIGADEWSPERISFDCFIDGVATSATVSGGGRFGRTFTP